MRYEYKLVAAPERANKVKGLKGADLFVNTIEEILNEFGHDGWQFVRIDTLPQEERVGLASKQTTMRHMLVFMREIIEESDIAPEPPVFEVIDNEHEIAFEDTDAPSEGESEVEPSKEEAILANLFAHRSMRN